VLIDTKRLKDPETKALELTITHFTTFMQTTEERNYHASLELLIDTQLIAKALLIEETLKAKKQIRRYVV